MSQPEQVADYITLFRRRLTRAYNETARALDIHKIPFQRGNSGLFVFIDLSKWIGYFAGPDLASLRKNNGSDIKVSREIQLCEFLIRHGVFLNAGEVSFEHDSMLLSPLLVFARKEKLLTMIVRWM